MIKLKKLVKFLKKDIKKGKKEVRQGSIIKYIVSFALGVILTCTAQIIIYKLDPSNFDGDKLKYYFISEICSELNYKDLDKMHIEYSGRYENNVFSTDNDIIVIGEYETESEDEEKNKDVIIAIFERGEKDIFDFILQTEAEYNITYIIETETIVGEYMFDYRHIDIIDLDKDGINEIVLDFKSNFATSECIYTIVLANKSNKWDIIQPDFKNLQDEVSEISDDYEIVLEEISAYDVLNNKEHIIYGLAYGGGVDFPYNSKFGIANFCYRIPIVKPNQGLLHIDTYAHLTLRLDGLDLCVDNSWNFGNILVDKYLSFEEICEHYGTTINGITYYGLP